MEHLDYLQDFQNRFDRFNEIEDEYLARERRQYKMLPRIDMDKWNDVDFVYRFRLEKRTVATVLILIEDSLKFRSEQRRAKIGSLLFYADTLALILQNSPGPSALLIACIFNEFNRQCFAIEKAGFLCRQCLRLNLKIIGLVCRWPGSTHDQTIINGSRIKYRFGNGDFGNFILVGDCGYRNTIYFEMSFLEASGKVKRLYNESRIRTQNVIERSYGELKRRFPILAYGIQLKLETVRHLIAPCCVLHNIAIDERDFLPRVEMAGFEVILQRTAEVNFEEALESSN